MRTKKIQIAGVFLALWGTASICMADDWLSPTKQTFYSENGRFAVTVVPKELEGRRDPRAFFYAVGKDGQFQLSKAFKLVNEVAPVTALASNDGRYLVTFDNWFSRGHGNDTIVIYRTDGQLIRSLSLEDVLTAEDIKALPRSVSSIHWGAEHYIDENSRVLVLRITRCADLPPCSEKPAEVTINLADGMPLHPETWPPSIVVTISCQA